MEAAAARLTAGSGGLPALALRLASKFSLANSTPGNLVFSPLSIYSALALVATGAKGKTLSELLAVLGASSRDELAANARRITSRAFPDRSRTVTYACGIWHDATLPLKPAYGDAAVASFQAETAAVDFINNAEGARKEVNRWVAAVTNNLIDSILPVGSVDAYTKWKWKGTPFDGASTNEHKFHRLDGTAVDAKFMCSGRDRHYVAVHDGFKVLKLPYIATDAARYAMCIILPDARDGLWGLLDEMLTSSPESFLRYRLPKTEAKVGELLLPKFKLDFSSGVTGVLHDMGIKAAFDMSEADFSDITDCAPLKVDDVIHKAVIKVDEEGTEAAATTMIFGFAGGHRREVEVDFVADHPFAFFLVEERSDAIVFAGHIVDPTTSV